MESTLTRRESPKTGLAAAAGLALGSLMAWGGVLRAAGRAEGGAGVQVHSCTWAQTEKRAHAGAADGDAGAYATER